MLSIHHSRFGLTGDKQSKRTFVRCRRIWPQHRLAPLGLEFGQHRARDIQSRHHVILRQLEAELLGVVVDNLDILQLERHEALVAARERLLDLARSRARGQRILDPGLGLLCGGGVLVDSVVADRAEGRGATENVEKSVAALGGRGLGGVAACLLYSQGSFTGQRRSSCCAKMIVVRD